MKDVTQAVLIQKLILPKLCILIGDINGDMFLIQFMFVILIWIWQTWCQRPSAFSRSPKNLQRIFSETTYEMYINIYMIPMFLQFTHLGLVVPSIDLVIIGIIANFIQLLTFYIKIIFDDIKKNVKSIHCLLIFLLSAWWGCKSVIEQ